MEKERGEGRVDVLALHCSVIKEAPHSMVYIHNTHRPLPEGRSHLRSKSSCCYTNTQARCDSAKRSKNTLWFYNTAFNFTEIMEHKLEQKKTAFACFEKTHIGMCLWLWENAVMAIRTQQALFNHWIKRINWMWWIISDQNSDSVQVRDKDHDCFNPDGGSTNTLHSGGIKQPCTDPFRTININECIFFPWQRSSALI